MKIQFVNHASFIVESEEIKFICDPWLEGEVFDNGWGLLAPSIFNYEDFKNITHIWFSHEHPDHFFPPNINKIPLEYRKNITVLFQETNDKKVVDFCRKKEFKEVIELPSGEWYKLSTDFTLKCTPCGDDSWLAIKAENKTILNLNDCVINTAEIANSIKSTLGLTNVDFLFTQFSYAQFEGNKNQPEKRRLAVKKKIEQMSLQISTFNPKYVVPFASFVWFCHEENAYMNDHPHRVDEVEKLLINRKVIPLILYTGDILNISPTNNEIVHNNAKSIDQWLKHYSEVSNRALKKTIPKNLSEILSASKQFQEDINSFFNFYSLDLMSPRTLRIHVSDLNVFIHFSVSNGSEVIEKSDYYDVEMSSETLYYCFKNPWGFNTTHVNGRMQATEDGMKKFKAIENVSDSLNHRHQTSNIKSYLKQKIKKIIYKTTGRYNPMMN